MSNPTTHDGAVLGSDGLHQDRPNTISTWTGRIDPLHPTPEEVNIEDIAHALARLCRYNGHVGGFLSVARHSIWVSERLERQGYDSVVQLQGLLHDGAEAYLSDIPRPVKRSPEMEVFRTFDQQMDHAVMDAFGLTFPIPDEVMAADHYVLMEVELPHPAGARYTWNSVPQEDERDFMKRYHHLQDRIAKVGTSQERPRLIGVAGYARAGKDTVGGYLRGRNYHRLAFADKLKAVALGIDPLVQIKCEATPLSGASAKDLCCDIRRVSELIELGADEDWLKANTDYREFLQQLGGQMRNVVGESVWIDAALADRDPARFYVITDVRYQNEIDAIRRAGGVVWRVEREGTGPANDHPSEREIEDALVDAVLVNDLDIPSLYFKIDRTLEGS